MKYMIRAPMWYSWPKRRILFTLTLPIFDSVGIAFHLAIGGSSQSDR